MRAGELKHIITVETYTEVKDSYGGVNTTWGEHTRTKASIKPFKGDESYISAEKHATASHLITIRYQPGITPAMRLKFNSRLFEIKSVLNIDESNHTLIIIAEETL